jgi:hypothetical protein
MTSIALDSNLLVLFCLGQASERYIGAHERIEAYSNIDFKDLLDFVSGFDVILSTPYALAEVSNLLNISKKRTKDRRVIRAFKFLIDLIEEISVSSRTVVARDEFSSFGVTDTAWLEYLGPNTIFLSADESLVNYAKAQGKQAEWFCPSRS